jgi:hypothetical protein
MSKRVSVAIPCYEMHNLGAEMLSYSFQVLEKQTMEDFEVVISDHSLNNEIYEVCNNSPLDIKYHRNSNKRGSSSANINNCIIHSSAPIIKILCQDDFLYNEYSLENLVNQFDFDAGWLISDYWHTYDRVNIINYHMPRLNDKLYLVNTVGTHSCLAISNDFPLLFDENLIWYMDCEYYYRLYKRYGNPKMLNSPLFVQLLWNGQVTNSIINDEIVNKEFKYVKELYEKSHS